MTLRAYIWGIRIITFFSLTALGIIINYIDPESAGPIGIVLFYLVVFFVFSGLFNLFLLFIRKKLLGVGLMAQNIGLSFRQGFLLAIVVLGLMILQSFQMLIWWDALLVVAGAFLIELFFLSRD